MKLTKQQANFIDAHFSKILDTVLEQCYDGVVQLIADENYNLTSIEFLPIAANKVDFRPFIIEPVPTFAPDEYTETFFSVIWNNGTESKLYRVVRSYDTKNPVVGPSVFESRLN